MGQVSKQQVLDDLLKLGKVRIVVHRVGGAVFPEGDGMLGEAFVPIFLSWLFCKPMEIDGDGVRADLIFGGVERHCFFPWECVISIRSTVDLDQFFSFSGEECVSAPKEKAAPKKPHLKLC